MRHRGKGENGCWAGQGRVGQVVFGVVPMLQLVLVGRVGLWQLPDTLLRHKYHVRWLAGLGWHLPGQRSCMHVELCNEVVVAPV